MMKTLFAISLFIAVGNICIGQIIMERSVQELKMEVDRLNFDYNRGIEGSPYLEKEFSAGIFYDNDGHIIETETRLNLFESDFELKVKGENALVTPSTIDSIIYKNSTYIFKEFDYNSINRVRALKKKSSTSNGGIYELNEVVFKDAVAAKGYTDPAPAKFEQESPVFVLVFKNDIIALTSISKLYKAFPDQEEKLKKFVKKNKVRKNNPEKLNDLLSYMEDTMK